MKAFKILATTLLILLCSWSSLEAQQLFRRTQYVFNPYLANPAVAGTKSFTPLMASYRQQWAGFNGAPTTYTISAHTNLPNGLGAGLIIFNDDAGGAITRTGAEITGSYKVDLNNEDQVSFGLSGVVSRFQFDNNTLEVLDQNDPNLAAGNENKTNFDANFGLMIYGRQYFYGFSINRLFQSELGITTISELTKNQNRRHFNVMASYDYDIDDNLTMQPSALIRFTGITPVQFDVHMKAIYQESFWLGISYRHQDALAPSFGIQVGDFLAGYSYDITTTKSVRELSPHTHEINIGYRITKGDPRFKNQNSIGKRRISKSRLI